MGWPPSAKVRGTDRLSGSGEHGVSLFLLLLRLLFFALVISRRYGSALQATAYRPGPTLRYCQSQPGSVHLVVPASHAAQEAHCEHFGGLKLIAVKLAHKLHYF